MKLTDFYLSIARQALTDLEACPGPIVLGDGGYTEHFRHAIICSVFSAFAVEHAMQELIWVRCFFQTPSPYRQAALLKAAKLRNIPEKLNFIASVSKIPSEVLRDMKSLFEYRNRIAHANIKSFEDYLLDFEGVEMINEEGRGADLDRAIELSILKGSDESLKALVKEFGKQATHLGLPSIGTQDLDDAEKNLRVAEAAVEAIGQQLESPNWPLLRTDKSKT